MAVTCKEITSWPMLYTCTVDTEYIMCKIEINELFFFWVANNYRPLVSRVPYMPPVLSLTVSKGHLLAVSLTVIEQNNFPNIYSVYLYLCLILK
jgi:hypothetical protein